MLNQLINTITPPAQRSDPATGAVSTDSTSSDAFSAVLARQIVGQSVSSAPPATAAATKSAKDQSSQPVTDSAQSSQDTLATPDAASVALAAFSSKDIKLTVADGSANNAGTKTHQHSAPQTTAPDPALNPMVMLVNPEIRMTPAITTNTMITAKSDASTVSAPMIDAAAAIKTATASNPVIDAAAAIKTATASNPVIDAATVIKTATASNPVIDAATAIKTATASNPVIDVAAAIKTATASNPVIDAAAAIKTTTASNPVIDAAAAIKTTTASNPVIDAAAAVTTISGQKSDISTAINPRVDTRTAASTTNDATASGTQSLTGPAISEPQTVKSAPTTIGAANGGPTPQDTAIKSASESQAKLDISQPTQAQLLSAQTQSALTVSSLQPNTTTHAIAAPLGSNAWSSEFTQKISWLGTQQSQVAELHLNPPDLGPMHVVISVTDNQATALFTSPHSEVRNAIENALPKLRESLADNGIMLGNATVSDQTPRDSGAGSFMNQRANNRPAVTGMAESAPITTRTIVTRRHTGILDTFA